MDGAYGAITDTAFGSTVYKVTPLTSVTTEKIATGMNMDVAYTAGWKDADLLQNLTCYGTGEVGKYDCYLFTYHKTGDPMKKINAWLDISGDQMPRFTNSEDIYTQMNTAHSEALCEIVWDAEKKAAKQDSKWAACSDISKSPTVTRTMSVAPVVKETCEPGFVLTLEIQMAHADDTAATTFANAVKERVKTFWGVTYFKNVEGTATVVQSSSTEAGNPPARPECAVSSSGASTWAPVAAALVFAAMS